MSKKAWKMLLLIAIFLSSARLLFAEAPGTVGRSGASGVQFYDCEATAFDSNGNLYTYSNLTQNLIEISRSGATKVFPRDYLGKDPDPNDIIVGLVFDSKGDMFFTKFSADVVMEKPVDSPVKVFAGDGVVSAEPGKSSDLTADVDGKGLKAHFNTPTGLTIDNHDNLYVSEYIGRAIRKISPEGDVTTIVGGGFLTTKAALIEFNKQYEKNKTYYDSMWGIAFNNNSKYIYFSDPKYSTVFSVSPTGEVTLVAGSPNKLGMKNGVAKQSLLDRPTTILVDKDENVIVADAGNRLVRKISTDGTISTLAGSSGPPNAENAIGEHAWFESVDGVAEDTFGNLFITGGAGVRKIDVSGLVTTFVGEKPRVPQLAVHPIPPPPPKFKPFLVEVQFRDNNGLGRAKANCNAGAPQQDCDREWIWSVNESNYPDYFIANWAGSWNYQGNPDTRCFLTIRADRRSLRVVCHAGPSPAIFGPGTHAYLYVSSILLLPEHCGPGKTDICEATHPDVGLRQLPWSCSCRSAPGNPGVGVLICTIPRTNETTVGGGCIVANFPNP